MLERGAAERHRAGTENLVLVRGNALEMPFADGSFRLCPPTA
jgi:ubiquinone/menaquinone biosynthesis C-methylase UbiE